MTCRFANHFLIKKKKRYDFFSWDKLSGVESKLFILSCIAGIILMLCRIQRKNISIKKIDLFLEKQQLIMIYAHFEIMTKFIEETARKFIPFNMNINIRFTEWMCLLSVYFPYTYVNIWCLLLWNPKDEWIKLDRYKVFPVFSPRTLGWFLVGCRLCTKSYIDIEIRNYVPYIAFTHIKPPIDVL